MCLHVQIQTQIQERVCLRGQKPPRQRAVHRTIRVRSQRRFQFLYKWVSVSVTLNRCLGQSGGEALMRESSHAFCPHCPLDIAQNIAHWTLPKHCTLDIAYNIVHRTLPKHCPLNISQTLVAQKGLPCRLLFQKLLREGRRVRLWAAMGRRCDSKVERGEVLGLREYDISPPLATLAPPIPVAHLFYFSSWLIWDDNGCRCRSIWTIFQTVDADIDINIEIDIDIGGLFVAG